MKRLYPMPEIVSQGKWTISQDWRARVDLGKSQMFVPLSADPFARKLRLHEMAHATYTPKTARKPRSVSDTSVQFAEDLRINRLACRAGLEHVYNGPVSETEQTILNGALKGAAIHGLPALVGYVIGSFTPDYWNRAIVEIGKLPDLSRDDFQTIKGIVSTCWRIMDRGPRRSSWTWKRTIAVAQYLDKQFAKWYAGDPLHDPDGNNGRKGERIAHSLNAQWGDCRLEKPPLVIPGRGKRVSVSDTGAILRSPHRLLIDGRIFRSQSRAPRRGSVLLDCSGSMALDRDKIEVLAKTIPAGIIAGYSSNVEDCDSGMVRIFADHGKIARDSAAFQMGGGNVVDGPALQWLSRQPKPRIWICDGAVTGIDDCCSDELCAEAEQLQHDHNIIRVSTADEALQLLKRR